MAHSFSSLKIAKQCMRQYHEVKVLKLHPYVQTEAAAFGDRAHQALENAGASGTPLPPEFAAYQWVVDKLFPLLPPKRVWEQEFAFRKDWAPCGPRQWNVKEWAGKADVAAMTADGSESWIIDWKTGNDKYPDEEQLDLMALFTMMYYPGVQRVKGFLVFLQTGKVVKREYTRADWPRIRAAWEADAKMIETAIAMGNWPESPSNLCPWCPVQTCQHWTPPKPKRIPA